MASSALKGVPGRYTDVAQGFVLSWGSHKLPACQIADQFLMYTVTGGLCGLGVGCDCDDGDVLGENNWFL